MNEGLNFATDHEQLKSTHPTGQDNAIEGQWMPSASPGNKQPRIQFRFEQFEKFLSNPRDSIFGGTK